MSENSPEQSSTDKPRKELEQELKRLGRLSTRGVLALSLFLVICILAWWDFPYLPQPDAVTSVIGAPPCARLISIALIIYAFSAIILSLCRMAQGVEHRSSFCHVGYLTAFFLFYYFSKALQQNFWAVFGAGITILGIESYRIWNHCAERILKVKENIEFLNRNGRLPPQ
ncbi:MAG: menaquinol oxidoreductase [Geobacteraceae bacterium]|nr:menaquinol oxidoreductase [Geobacteraceae bacterium]